MLIVLERILVVEDNKVVNTTISRVLSSSGYHVDSVFNAEDALSDFNKNEYDLIILDLNLPKMNGFTFLQVIRKKSDVPVIVNTSYADVKSRVKLIHVGASDFIEKSFEPSEILESVKIILDDRQKIAKKNKVIKFKDVVIDFSTRTVSKAGIPLDLTSKELDILKLLTDNPTKAFSRKQLYLVVWGEEYNESFDNTINVHVKRLRNKIENAPNKPEIIETVYAFGYRLGKPVVALLQDKK